MTTGEAPASLRLVASNSETSSEKGRQLCEERLREEVGEHFVELGRVERDHGLSGLELGLDLGCATLGNLPVLFGPFLGCLLGAGQRDRKRADAKGFDGERLSDPGGGGAEVG